MAAPAAISALNRKADLEKLRSETFDVVVIGGGIMGAGIALDAASRNLRVLLLEKQDFAAGTSSRSTKLIHGGLRYLKNFEFGLVAPVAQERKILHRNAPHLVTREPMLLPVLEKTSYPIWAVAAGLTLYELLGKVGKAERHRMFSKRKTLALEPLLNPAGLKGSGLFTEYRTDDARLTLEVLKTAQSYGATCLNYVAVTGFQKNSQNQIVGVTVQNQFTKETTEVKTTCVINATGPWSAALMQMDQPVTEPLLFHTKGVHLVVPHNRFPLKQAVYFDIPGGRMLFAIPRGAKTYLGTTDTPYKAALENPEVTKEDAAYLLKEINQMFPSCNLTLQDVESSWAGIRPLLYQKGKKPTDLSRKDEVFVSPSGLISVAGGKLTGYRHFAAVVVDKALEVHFPHLKASSQTKNLKLRAGNFVDQHAVQTFQQTLISFGKQFQFPEEKIAYLVKTYGTFAREIVEIAARSDFGSPPETRLLKAEIQYTVQAEGALTISDFLIRRTGMLYFDRNRIPEILNTVDQTFQEILGYDSETMQHQLAEFDKHYQAAVAFKTSSADQVPGL